MHFRLPITPHDLLRHRDSRINVSASAAGSDQYLHFQLPIGDCRFTRSSCLLLKLAIGDRKSAMVPLACCETFSRMPTAASVGTIDDPPYEMNGSGIPFVGTNESTTLILKSAWATMLVTIPILSNIPNLSGASRAVRMPRQRNSANIATTVSAPTNPNSSPTTA